MPDSASPVPAEIVRRAWMDATVVLGADPVGAARQAEALIAGYDDPPRHYHGLAHVAFVLDCVRALDVGLGTEDVAVIHIAAAAHDIVYRGRAGVDEAESASWAVAALTGTGVSAERTGRVRDLILATAHHRAGNDPLAAVLLDADLAILAEPPSRYAEYVTAVRCEYEHVDDEQWRTGRAVVLHGLLDRERIYATELGSAREAAARANMTAELATLTGGPAGG